MSDRRPYTEEEARLVVELFRQGLRVQEIAVRLGRPYSGVWAKVKRFQDVGVLPTPWKRDLSVCPRCELGPRTVSPRTGRVRAYCNGCEAERTAEFTATPAGQAVQARWQERLKARRREARLAREAARGGSDASA